MVVIVLDLKGFFINYLLIFICLIYNYWKIYFEFFFIFMFIEGNLGCLNVGVIRKKIMNR